MIDFEAVEVGKSISAANAKKLRAAMTEISDLLAQIAPVEAASVEEEKQEAALVEMEIVGDPMVFYESAGAISLANLPDTTAMWLHEAGSGLIKIIQPGWGSSGYYPASVLERDAKAFKAGTQMFWNHQTPAQEAAQPEGDLNSLVGVLKEDAQWMANGAKGAGLYAPITVFDKFHSAVKEMSPYIGVSIRATGMGRKDGEAEGRKGPILEKFTAAKSVDYVTRAGAGGEVISMFEAAGRQAPPANPQREEQENMGVTQEQFDALKESITKANEKSALMESETKSLRVRLALAEGKEFATGILAGIEMPAATRAQLLSRMIPLAPISEAGVLDQPKFKELITAEATREIAYVSGLIGSGRVVGMGGGTAHQEAPKPEDVDKELASNLSRLGGLTEAGGKLAAEGRRFVA